MNFLKNMKIGAKLRLVFGLLLLLVTVNTILGVSNIMHINSDYYYTIEYPNRRYYILYSLGQQITNMQRIIASVAVHSGEHDEEAAFADLEIQLNSVISGLRNNIDNYKSLIHSDPRLTEYEQALSLANMTAVQRTIEAYLERVANRIFYVAQVYGHDEATNLVREGTATYGQIYSHLSVIYGVYSGRMYAVSAYLNNTATIAIWTLITIAVVCITMGIFVAIIASKAISIPIKEVAVALDNVSEGNLSVVLNSDREDEIGQLTKSTQRMVETLQNLIGDLEFMANNYDKGETDTYVESARYTGAYKDVAEKVNYICQAGNKAQTIAEEANKTKSNFLATMSHEIRTPLNAIIGITQILLQKENLSDEYAAALDKIFNSGDSLLRIINDILDMSKIEMGKFELVDVEYNVPELINDTVRLNIVRIDSKPIDFLLDVSEDLPAKLQGDDTRIKQIMNNLLSNAIKYTDKGRIKLSISHSLLGDDVELRLSISDTGQGMKSYDVEKLFSAYSRFNSEANRSTEGTGLGLNITRQLVEMMGGTIKVESEFGKGSTFIATIRQKMPIYAPIGPEIAKKLCDFTFASSNQSAKTQIDRSPMPYGKVLVVDDMETNLYVAEGLLLPYMLEIETATSGYATLEKISNGITYDIIFMDHMMPHMDGIETVQKMRELGYTGTIVALTANALVGNSEIFMQNGFDGFISKPIDITVLDEVLNKFIRAKQPKRATPVEAEKIHPRLINAFLRDAKSAVTTIKQTQHNDIKLFTTTVHAMKSALANIREFKISQLAANLEDAGYNNNTMFITAHAGTFVQKLEELITKLSPAEPTNTATTEENTTLLTEQMLIIKTACENYRAADAYAAISILREKSWSPKTFTAIEEINDTLRLHSDFEKAAELADELRSI